MEATIHFVGFILFLLSLISAKMFWSFKKDPLLSREALRCLRGGIVDPNDTEINARRSLMPCIRGLTVTTDEVGRLKLTKTEIAFHFNDLTEPTGSDNEW
ncbi:MAG: hypothetical protein UZ19_OD1000452 [Parcubacteria bacterium OLB19]|nr:MAG: hypothetical protein UZ19_OD1000452 [Parcubacteria bacterium OLB19]